MRGFETAFQVRFRNSKCKQTQTQFYSVWWFIDFQCCQIWRKFAKWAKFKGMVAMGFLQLAMAKLAFKIAKNGRNSRISQKIANFGLFLPKKNDQNFKIFQTFSYNFCGSSQNAQKWCKKLRCFFGPPFLSFSWFCWKYFTLEIFGKYRVSKTRIYWKKRL